MIRIHLPILRLTAAFVVVTLVVMGAVVGLSGGAP